MSAVDHNNIYSYSHFVLYVFSGARSPVDPSVLRITGLFVHLYVLFSEYCTVTLRKYLMCKSAELAFWMVFCPRHFLTGMICPVGEG